MKTFPIFRTVRSSCIIMAGVLETRGPIDIGRFMGNAMILVGKDIMNKIVQREIECIRVSGARMDKINMVSGNKSFISRISFNTRVISSQS